MACCKGSDSTPWRARSRIRASTPLDTLNDTAAQTISTTKMRPITGIRRKIPCSSVWLLTRWILPAQIKSTTASTNGRKDKTSCTLYTQSIFQPFHWEKYCQGDTPSSAKSNKNGVSIAKAAGISKVRQNSRVNKSYHSKYCVMPLITQNRPCPTSSTGSLHFHAQRKARVVAAKTASTLPNSKV